MHRIYQKRKGFTLIELLVTVGIIVILATLIIINITQARMNGRDSKRIADVASIQLALEMYRNTNGQYPPESSGWAAATGGGYQTLWDQLSNGDGAADKGLSPYLSPLPKDPLNKSGGYRYYVDMKEDRTGAIIKTKLEANPEKMTEDSCPNNGLYYDVISGNFPGGIDDKKIPGTEILQNNCDGNVGYDGCTAIPCERQSWAVPIQ